MNQTSATQTAGDSKPVIEIVEQSLYEVRKHIYPRSVSGPFASWRLVFVVLTQLLYYGLPWLSWNDRRPFYLIWCSVSFISSGWYCGHRM
jgi:hypothetical protein